MLTALRRNHHLQAKFNSFWILIIIYISYSYSANGAILKNEPQNQSKQFQSLPSITNVNGNTKEVTDSYGNPIEYSKPIETPDGRKVISAQGVQFELPNYASGITEIRKPAENLLPPFVGESSTSNNEDNTELFTINGEGNETITGKPSNNSLANLEIIQIFNISNNDTHQAFSQQKPLRTSTSIEMVDLIETSSSEEFKNKISSPISQHQEQSSSFPSFHVSSESGPDRITSSLSEAQFNSNNSQISNNSLTDLYIINKIESKYHKPIPTTLDPVADQPDWENLPTSTTESSIEIVNAELVELTTEEPQTSTEFGTVTESQTTKPIAALTDNSKLFNGIPAWLVDYNDTDVGPGVSYDSQKNSNKSKILTWDLVPPLDMEPFEYKKENSPVKSTAQSPQKDENEKVIRISLSPGQSFGVDNHSLFEAKVNEKGTTTIAAEKLTTIENENENPNTTDQSVITTTEELFALPGGNSYTLPPWLADIDDINVAGAVTYVAPTISHNHYEHTLNDDVLPPLETFTVITLSDITSTPAIEASTDAQTQKPPHSLQTTTTQQTETTSTIFTNKHKPTSSPAQNATTRKPNETTQSPIYSTTIETDRETVSASEVVPSLSGNNFHNFLSTISSSPETGNRFSKDKSSGSLEEPMATTTSTRSAEETFESTSYTPAIPHWLKGYNDPDVGPGVPFVYVSSTIPTLSIFNDLLPPPRETSSNEDIPKRTKPVDYGYNSNPFFSNIRPISNPVTISQRPNTNPFLKSPPKLPSFSSHSVTEPSKLLVPPSMDAGEVSHKSTHHNNNFAAPFDQEPTRQRETSPDESIKAGFGKSDEEKGTLNGDSILQAAKPFMFNTPQKGQDNFDLNPFLVPSKQPALEFRQTTSSLASGFKSPTTPTTVFEGKYTGKFGGAPGVLGRQRKPGYAIQPDGSIRDPDHTYRPPSQNESDSQKPAINTVSSFASRSGANDDDSKYTGKFGGPPGLLVPYDNVKRTGR